MDKAQSERINKVKSKVPSTVDVIVVTKTLPFTVIQTAVKSGFRHIGENRVDEAAEKIGDARRDGLDPVVWHMIGHVQSRKVSDVVALFDRVDSVDSKKLAAKLSADAVRRAKELRILLEVNLTGEVTKLGFDLAGWEKSPSKFEIFLRSVQSIVRLQNIIVDGLMTMPPYAANAEDNRLVFRDMVRLSKTIRAQMPSFGPVLSMGTSCDYPIAIEEGATEVRLGEALFGRRPG